MGIADLNTDERNGLFTVMTEGGNVFEIVCRQAAGKEDGWMTASYGRGNYKQAPPQILLQGKWLEQTGFSAGDKIIVKCQQGQLIITKNGTRKDSGE